jgi:CubicO group peptidase (beta-lactamase class C family)
MWTTGRTADGKDTGYGLGWGIGAAQAGFRRFSHSGNHAGASGALVVIPEAGVSYAILTNLEDAELGALSRGIAGGRQESNHELKSFIWFRRFRRVQQVQVHSSEGSAGWDV